MDERPGEPTEQGPPPPAPPWDPFATRESDQPPEPPPVWPPQAAAPSGGGLAAGWSSALVWAVITAVAGLVLAEAVVFVSYALAGNAKPTVKVTSQVGVVLFMLFHHVGFVVEASRLNFSAPGLGQFPSGVRFEFVVAVALMAGTLLTMWLLYRGGRAVAGSVGGSSWGRGLQGMKVAAPYALIVLLLSFLAHFTPTFPGESGIAGRVSLRPSYLAAVFWPLALGALMGFMGGFRSGGDEQAGGVWTRRLRGAVAGGWTMLLVGLVVAYVALLLLGAVKPEARPFGTNIDTQGGASSLASSSMLTVLTVPNRAALVLFPSMGSCVTASIRSSGFGFSLCFLSYQHFLPSGRATASLGQANPLTGLTPNLPAAPVGYYAFLVVPLIAVLLGGLVAARRAGVESRSEAAGVGALAGVVFGLLALVAVVLASVTIRASATGQGVAPLGGSGAATGSAGPDPVSSVMLALVWGVAGGALGGLIQGRSLSGRTAPAVVPGSEGSFGFGTPQPPPSPPPPPAPGRDPWGPRTEPEGESGPSPPG